jgi:prolyl-tRNA synthetase
MGPRDLENGTVELARRDTREKTVVPAAGLTERVQGLLEEIQ